MDGSAHIASDPAPSATSMAARALASAAVFGTVGAYLGKWLGERGSAPQSGMAKPIMKWSMAGFWAVLAAYSSLKASQQEMEQAKAKAPESPRLEPPTIDMLPEAAKVEQPHAVVHTQGAQHAGEVASEAALQRG